MRRYYVTSATRGPRWHLFHLTGALLAVPCMSIAQSLFQNFRAEIQTGDPEFASDPPVISLPPQPPKT